MRAPTGNRQSARTETFNTDAPQIVSSYPLPAADCARLSPRRRQRWTPTPRTLTSVQAPRSSRLPQPTAPSMRRPRRPSSPRIKRRRTRGLHSLLPSRRMAGADCLRRLVRLPWLSPSSPGSNTTSPAAHRIAAPAPSLGRSAPSVTHSGVAAPTRECRAKSRGRHTASSSRAAAEQPAAEPASKRASTASEQRSAPAAPARPPETCTVHQRTVSPGVGTLCTLESDRCPPLREGSRSATAQLHPPHAHSRPLRNCSPRLSCCYCQPFPVTARSRPAIPVSAAEAQTRK